MSCKSRAVCVLLVQGPTWIGLELCSQFLGLYISRGKPEMAVNTNPFPSSTTSPDILSILHLKGLYPDLTGVCMWYLDMA